MIKGPIILRNELIEEKYKFFFNYHIRMIFSNKFCGEALLHGWLTGALL
jgi:hypothetical protein